MAPLKESAVPLPPPPDADFNNKISKYGADFGDHLGDLVEERRQEELAAMAAASTSEEIIARSRFADRLDFVESQSADEGKEGKIKAAIDGQDEIPSNKETAIHEEITAIKNPQSSDFSVQQDTAIKNK